MPAFYSSAPAPRPPGGRLALELDLLDPGVPRSAPAPVTAANGVRLLVVDDDDDLRAYVRACLEPAWQVAEARDGRAAVDSVRRVRPALVLTDVRMPSGSGADLLSALRTDPDLCTLPVLALSGEAFGLDGADAFLAKPFTRAQLVAAVEHLLAVRF